MKRLKCWLLHQRTDWFGAREDLPKGGVIVYNWTTCQKCGLIWSAR